MLNLILAIPENIGWTMVGASGMLLIVMVVKSIKCAVTMYKEYREEMNENDDIMK